MRPSRAASPHLVGLAPCGLGLLALGGVVRPRLTLISRPSLPALSRGTADELAQARAEIERLRGELDASIPLWKYRGLKTQLQRKRREHRAALDLLAAALTGERLRGVQNSAGAAQAVTTSRNPHDP